MKKDKASTGIYAHTARLKTPPGTAIHLARYCRHDQRTRQIAANGFVIQALGLLHDLANPGRDTTELDAWVKEKTKEMEILRRVRQEVQKKAVEA